ncbi:Ig-like domain-containing protein [Moritella dasanensis]|uniref:Ig-like domain-containing protein n=1 Tax=Moritella dasanensis TaxID=428031 RepID=UPI00037C9789|nr:NEW3 domain-containing protein [Moritella dasanensis]
MKHLVLGIFVSISTLLTIFPVTAESKGNPFEGTISIEALEHRTLAQNKTMALAKLMANYRHADKSNNKQLLNELIEQAKARQALLAELVKTDPGAAIRATLPKHVRAGMPAEVQALLEQKQELNGELEVVYEDYEDPSLNRLHHTLITDKDRVELYLPENYKGNSLQSGTKVRASGWLFKQGDDTVHSLAVNDDQVSLTVLAAGGSTTSSSTTTAPLANTTGEQRTLVLLINFQDNSSEQPWTIAEANDMIFGTVSDYYRESSYGQTWLSGDVLGYLTLPINATCDFGTMDGYAQQAAIDSGIDVASYDRLIYLFPKNSTCGWRGQGTLGGTPSRSWINGELNLLTIGHELGHNLGLKHAKELSCDRGYISDSCVEITYGDVLDIMGKSEGHFNAFNKERLGWLTPEQGEIVTADSDGSYLLEPYETASNGMAKGLKVRRGADAVTGEQLWYYLEYRQPLGFDAFLAGKVVTGGVLVHLNSSAEDITSSLLLDMTPHSSVLDLDDAALLAGVSYTDVDAGVTITTEWADNSGASVNVSYSGQNCVKASPSLLLSPNESAWVTSGTTVTYSAAVTNNDSNDCASADFNVAANVPSGWATSSNSLSLAPGASGSVIINVTSASTASDGFYDIAISAKNSTDSSYFDSGVVSYVVDTPTQACVVANPQLSLTNSQGDAVTPGSSVAYTATVKNQNSDSCAVTNFDLAANVPTGWTASNTRVSLASGNSATVNLNVTSATSATDGVYNFSINAQNSADASYSNNTVASYTVTTPPPVCVAANPLISLSGPSGSVTAGATINYNATVTNLDSESCATANFNVLADIPAGWNANSASIDLVPGASTTVTLSVTSTISATDGVYNIAINAENSANSNYSNSGVVSYAISTPVKVNNAPVAVTDSEVLATKEPIFINVLGNDWDPENDTLSVSAVSQGAKGSVQIASDGRLLYTPAKSFKSSDSFSYTISDGDKVATATVNLSLTNSGGGKGKGNGKG